MSFLFLLIIYLKLAYVDGQAALDRALRVFVMESIACDLIPASKNCIVGFCDNETIVRLMDFKQGLDRTKNTPIVRKAKLGIKLKVIMSSFISWLSSGLKSVASYYKIWR